MLSSYLLRPTQFDFGIRATPRTDFLAISDESDRFHASLTPTSTRSGLTHHGLAPFRDESALDRPRSPAVLYPAQSVGHGRQGAFPEHLSAGAS